MNSKASSRMSRDYTLSVTVTLDTLQTLVDGNYKLILGNEKNGVLTQLPHWDPVDLPELPDPDSEEGSTAAFNGVDIEASWTSEESSIYMLGWAFLQEEEQLFTDFGVDLKADNPYVSDAVPIDPGKAYELVLTGEDGWDLKLSKKSAPSTGAVGFVNSIPAQPILFRKKEVTTEDGTVEIRWEAVSRAKNVWLPGKGSLKIPGADTVSAWFHSEDQDTTTEGLDAEDSSNPIKLQFKYGHDKRINYDPEGETVEDQWNDDRDEPQQESLFAPVDLQTKPSSRKAAVVKDTGKDQRIKFPTRKRKTASGAANGFH
ncbi:hypothetical protein BT63DRAFT_10844 [Microthyrium microscopicum]|uniref:Uncharacterized protein n=1 Tax=Microthyrium microscopicum TaxID=703497 RepID=A0A6A6UQB8_9PEZI|nr:hypothetical protein BT63DRAFT_10844 [Microthyrium microscopicum]